MSWIVSVSYSKFFYDEFFIHFQISISEAKNGKVWSLTRVLHSSPDLVSFKTVINKLKLCKVLQNMSQALSNGQ